MNLHKKGLVDKWVEMFSDDYGSWSFADLGAVWGCGGEYTFYAVEEYSVSRAALVDFELPLEIEQRAVRAGVDCVRGYVGDPGVVSKVGEVDVLFLFDLLLHLAEPNWDEVLRLYSSVSDHFLIFNPMWQGLKTVRLLELGEKEYFRVIPHQRLEEPYKSVFDDLDGIHPVQGIRNRDISNIWQWGIAEEDLRIYMARLGFRLTFRERDGMWGSGENFVSVGYIFSRDRGVCNEI